MLKCYFFIKRVSELTKFEAVLKVQFIIKHPYQYVDNTSTKHKYGHNRRNISLTDSQV